MSDAERALRSNCPSMCPCICHDGFGGAHHGQRCAEPQEEWHFAYLGMEYRHAGRKEDCEACANWKLPTPESTHAAGLQSELDRLERPYETTLDADERGDR